ncbi:hypothetical protein JHD46_04260 [Sulfurimonas sp. SAG-AH-194-C20]|nr:hypothetical protein [Sulfurimonas sp. SAG-AH-194-C20]MDF1878851.1 hypothetical protein [Sulfurimonas sp. SAG-AH-194-C20]
MIKLILPSRPDDARLSIQESIIKQIESKYKDAVPEQLMLDRTQYLVELENVKEKILSHTTKAEKIILERKAMLKQWELFVKDVNSSATKHNIDIKGLSISDGALLTGRTLVDKFNSMNPEVATYSGKRIPQVLSETKLEDLQIEEYEINVSLEVVQRMIKEKAQLYREMLELSA